MVLYLTRYIAKSVVSHVVLVLFVLVGVQSFLTLVAELSSLGQGHYNLADAIMVLGFHLPGYVYQLFPMAGLVGSMIGLGRLATTGEIVVMQAAGYSIARVARAVMLGAIMLLLPMLVLGEWAGPYLNQQADRMKAIALGHALSDTPTALWSKQGRNYLYLGRMDSASHAREGTYFVYAGNGYLQNMVYAKNIYQQSGQGWLWLDAKQTLFKPDVAPKAIKPNSLQIDMKVNKRLAVKGQMKSSYLTLPQVYHRIQSGQQVGLVETTLRFNFWHRLLQPLTTIIMICLGVPFIFGALRETSAGVRVMIGIAVGFLFYVLNQVLGPLALVLQITPVIAAFIPAVIFLVIYLAAGRRFAL